MVLLLARNPHMIQGRTRKPFPIVWIIPELPVVVSFSAFVVFFVHDNEDVVYVALESLFSVLQRCLCPSPLRSAACMHMYFLTYAIVLEHSIGATVWVTISKTRLSIYSEEDLTGSKSRGR